jgi:hypothetical protein
MKYLFTIALAVILFTGCTKDKKQTTWKVKVTSDNPFYSANVKAGLKGNAEFNEGTGENYNQTSWEKEFKASKFNEVIVATTSYSLGNITIQIYMKGDLKKEQTFQGTTNGTVSQHSLSYTSE